MKRPPAWSDGLRAAAESSVYSPVWVLPVLLIAGTFVPAGDSWWIRQLHTLRSNPLAGFTVVGLLVILRPAIVVTAPFVLSMFGVVFVKRSWAERLGDDLVACIRQKLPAGNVRAALDERMEEGNADAEHVDAAMWAWVLARYEHNPGLEQTASRRVIGLVSRAALKERAIVWCLRAWAKLGAANGHLLPPICAAALRRR